ncbi:MAG: septation protein SepH [Actinomycetota bacterium]|nr:septation protein SepH [Actinomycetota bacterium]
MTEAAERTPGYESACDTAHLEVGAYRRRMRHLRFVGPGRDLDHVIVETADGDEQFSLYIDAAMRDAVRADLPRLHPSSPASAEPATISPREIQMRVRSGASPQDLADANEMALDRVMRFASPVLEERGRVSQEARRARARRSTVEAQSVVFGDSVDARFAAHGIEPSAVGWDARRREDGQWVVNARWTGGEVERLAEWLFNLTTRTVTPLDETAADLLSDRPIRPLSPPTAAEPERPSLAAAPPLAKGVVAFPSMESRTEPLPSAMTAEEVFDQDALGDGGASEPADFHAPRLPLRLADVPEIEESYDLADQIPLIDRGQPGEQPTPVGAPAAGEPEPPVPPRLKNLGVAHREDETDEQRLARARIPSWDDILLGVRRKTD